MSSPQWFSRLMILVIAFTLCGGPQIATAQQAAAQPNEQQPVDANNAQPNQQSTAERNSSQQNVGTTPESATPDPSKGPLTPSDQLPNAPSASQQKQEDQQPSEAPLGAAAAQAARTTGGAASKPAGTAIAPAKQRQTRSLLIKVGAIAAGAAALGIVYGLTRGTSSVPPGANTATTASAAQAQH